MYIGDMSHSGFVIRDISVLNYVTFETFSQRAISHSGFSVFGITVHCFTKSDVFRRPECCVDIVIDYGTF